MKYKNIFENNKETKITPKLKLFITNNNDGNITSRIYETY